MESIGHDVHIDDPEQAERFVEALEEAKRIAKEFKPVAMSKPVRRLSKAEVAELFGRGECWEMYRHPKTAVERDKRVQETMKHIGKTRFGGGRRMAKIHIGEIEGVRVCMRKEGELQIHYYWPDEWAETYVSLCVASNCDVEDALHDLIMGAEKILETIGNTTDKRFEVGKVYRFDVKLWEKHMGVTSRWLEERPDAIFKADEIMRVGGRQVVLHDGLYYRPEWCEEIEEDL